MKLNMERWILNTCYLFDFDVMLRFKNQETWFRGCFKTRGNTKLRSRDKVRNGTNVSWSRCTDRSHRISVSCLVANASVWSLMHLLTEPVDYRSRTLLFWMLQSILICTMKIMFNLMTNITVVFGRLVVWFDTFVPPLLILNTRIISLRMKLCHNSLQVYSLETC